MRFLVDQDVYAATIRLLQAAGHEVRLAGKLGLIKPQDAELLAAARESGSIMVTRDRDFGNLVFVHEMRSGVIYLRISPLTVESVHNELQRVLGLYSAERLLKSFVVVEPGQHRIRELDT